MAELELAARVKKLEQQQIRLLKEINAAVNKITKACDRALVASSTPKKKVTPRKPVKERYKEIIAKGNQSPHDSLE